MPRSTNHDSNDGGTTGDEEFGSRASGHSGAGESEMAVRRRLLTSLGTVAVPATAGPSDEPTNGTDDPETITITETDQRATSGGTARDEPDDEVIHPRYGYLGIDDERPPVDPDHTVRLEVRSRDGTPIPECFFEPAGLAVEAGDTVRFDLATPHLNVNAYHPSFGFTRRVPRGVRPYSSPVLSGGEYWLYTFEREGVHDLMCSSHELFGMVGRVVVGSPGGPGSMPVGEAPGPERARPPEFTAALVLSDPALEPERIAKQGRVSWSGVAPESKRQPLRYFEQ